MEDLYNVLQVISDADEKEIKKAYVKMLRKYPPEKAPEEFKKIREAYEVLSDPIARAEYDAISQHKEEIDYHAEKGNEAYNNEDYKTAIREYKKILIIEPKFTYAKNMLGLALLYDGQLDAALKQFIELVNINPNNAAYHSNLGIVYKNLVKLDNAIEELEKAHSIDPVNDNIIISLSRLYLDTERPYKAIEFLEECINRDNSDDFQDFIYYFEMVQIYLLIEDEYGLEETFDRIGNIIPDDDEAKAFVSWRFGKFAYELYELQHYSLAEKIAKKALEIDENNETIEELYNNSHELSVAFDLMERLMNDDTIISPIKGPLIIYFYHESFNDSEKEEIANNSVEAIQEYIDKDYNSVIKSINRLKSYYGHIYKFKEEIYEDILKLANNNKILHDEYRILKNDDSINDSIKALISLWLSNDLNDEKRNDLFEKIIRRIGNEPSDSIYNSIVNLNSRYKNLYNLNPKALNEIKKVCENNSNSTYNKRTTTTASSSSGCLMAIIFTLTKILSLSTIVFFVNNIIA